jgi:copper chaperone NosL
MIRSRNLFILSVVLVFATFAAAQDQSDIQMHASCKYCGMDRAKFDFSRMLIQYEDGSSVGLCSIHCAALELANSIDKSPTSIQVGDFNTKNLIDAETAVWVIGGSKPGVMTRQGKWAFAKKEDAEAFMKSNGGTITSFEEALKTSFADLYQDTKMIREKRKARHQKMSGME